MTEFDLDRAVQVFPPAAAVQEPAGPLFDLDRLVPLNLPPEQVYIEKTGETVEVPAGSSNTMSQIWSKGLDKGDNATTLSKLYFEQFSGNDNPLIQKQIKRLQALTSGKIKTDGTLDEMLRASAEQIGILKEMMQSSIKRGTQGAMGGAGVGFAFAGVGSVPGFFGGLTAGAIAGALETSFILETGSLFNEIRGFKDNKGNNIDINIARMGAVMGGSLSAGLEALPVGLMLRLVPGARTAIKRLGLKATDKLNVPTNPKAFRNLLVNMSTIVAVETATEVVQELVQTAAGEVAKNVSPEDFKPVTGKEVLDRVAHAMEETLKASPLIAFGFSSPRYVQDLATRKEQPTVDPKVEKIKMLETEVIDRVTDKIKKSPISDDMKTFDAKLTIEEEEILADAGIEVAPDGSIPVSDAELVASESMRRTEAYDMMVSQAQTTAERGEAEVLRKVSRERIRKIDKDVAALDQRVDETLETISERKEQGKTTKALDNRVYAMLEEREVLDKERGDLLTADTPMEQTKQGLKATDKTVELKGVELVKAKAREAKAVERSINKILTKGVQLAKKDVKAAQTAVIEAIKNSGLSKEDISAFMVAVRNVQSAAQFAKAMPRIQNRIKQKLNLRRAQKATQLLKAALKRTVVKNNKGKFGPEIQEVLDIARSAMNETKETAAEKLQFQESSTEIFTPEMAFRNRILAFRADPKATDVEIIEKLLEDVVALMTAGKSLRASTILRTQEENAATRDELLDLIGEERLEETNRQQIKREFFARVETKTFLNLSGAWWNKLYRVMRSSDKGRVDAMVVKLSLYKENRAFDRGSSRAVERFTELVMATGDYASVRALMKKLSKDETTHTDLGTYEHSDGVRRNLSAELKTTAQLRKRIMELREPAIKKSLMHEEGNAYTPEIVEVLERALSEEDYRLIAAELQFYNEYYNRINEVYRRTNGINLPKVEFYSPVRRVRGKEGDTKDEFLSGMITMYRGGVAPSSLKSRTPNIHRVRASGDLAVLHSHINEMEYFIAYAEKLQSLNNTIGHKTVQTRIDRVFGGDILDTVNSDLDYFSKKGVYASEVGDKLFTTLMRNFSFAQLGAKPQIGLKQLASFAAYAQDVKTSDFTAGLVAFAANPRAALKVLQKSELFAKRGMNIDRDYKALLSDTGFFNFMGKNPGFAKIIMLPIKYGDKGAIAIGGFAHYHAMLKKNGGDKAAAIRSMETLTVRTQQSSDVDQISRLQRTSSFTRIMTQFMSSANALTRAEYSAIIERKANRITRGEFVKRILIYHVIIPTTIQFIANGFSWDNEDQLRASLLGSLNGLFVIGDILEMGAAYLTDGMEGVHDLKTRHPMSFISDLMKGVDDFSKNDISFEDFIEGAKSIDHLSRGLGAMFGIPIATIMNEMRGFGITLKGINKSNTDDLIEGPALMLGYSPYIIDKKMLQ
jgi:hypothetical protein